MFRSWASLGILRGKVPEALLIIMKEISSISIEETYLSNKLKKS